MIVPCIRGNKQLNLRSLGIFLGILLVSHAHAADPNPLVGAEFELEIPTTTPSPAGQFSPAVASDGTNYLAVWQDNRNGSGLDLYAARITTNGLVLDPSGFAISKAIDDQWHPSIAFNGTNFLVAWQDGRNGTQDIYARFVTPEGELLDTNEIAITKLSSDQRLPSVSSLDGDFLIAWQDGRNGASNQDIFAAQVQGNGSLIQTNGFTVIDAANGQSAPVVATVGANYLIAWHDFRSGVNLDVYAARVDSTGDVVDANGIVVGAAAHNQWNPTVIGHGDTALIAWEDSRNGTDDDVFGARIGADGTVSDPTGIPIFEAAGQQRRPSIGVINENFFVTWQDNQSGTGFDLIGASVQTSDGSVSPADGVSIVTAANDQRHPSVATGDNQLLVVWEDIRSGTDTDIYATRIDSQSSVLDLPNVVVSTVSTAQETPVVASNGNIHLVVWRDFRNDPLGDIYGTRVDHNGTILDSSALPISTAGNYQMLPRVAASGSDFLVVWQDFRNGLHDDIFGCRVLADGTISDPSGIPLTSSLGAQREPAVAGNTNGWLVVWQDRRASSNDDIYGTRVSTAGTVQDSNGIGVGVHLVDQTSPSIATLNGDYFVVWQDNRSIETNRVFGNTVTASGTIGTNGGFQLVTALTHQTAPQIAASANQYLVTWQQLTNDSKLNIHGARISASGTVQDSDGFTVVTATGDQQLPVVSAKGEDFIVAWEDTRTPDATNIFTARISNNGGVLDLAGALSSPKSGQRTAPSVANSGDNYFLVYQTLDKGNISRVRAAQLFPAAAPAISLAPGSVQFVTGGNPVPIDESATLIDGENANFESGTLTVSIGENGTDDDRLSIQNIGTGSGEISVAGNTVSYENQLIGFFTGGTSGNTPLLIILNNLTSSSAVEALAQNITFNNINALPFTQPRQVEFALNVPSGAGAPSSRTVTVVDSGSVPSIITPPETQTVSSGKQTTLTVVASGSQPLQYQWRLNGLNIVGATNSTYEISSMSTAKAGSYTVHISNTYGSTVSDVTELTYFDISMYAGLTVAGSIGTNYRIEYIATVGNKTNWTTLTNVTLESSSYLFIDDESPQEDQRFYRAIAE